MLERTAEHYKSMTQEDRDSQIAEAEKYVSQYNHFVELIEQIEQAADPKAKSELISRFT